MSRTTLCSIVRSWCTPESSENTFGELQAWIDQLNAGTRVEIRKIPLSEGFPWFYDQEEGCIRNQDRSFFTIKGCRWEAKGRPPAYQPVILQEEIGVLGMICQEIGGVMHFLMQAKIEPGNVNGIQISPTVQATKSNFTRRHGGSCPPYLDYFFNASRYELVADQLQSEQSSRFVGKRNRNMIIRVEEPVELLPSYRWMTLGQIKRFMRKDNLVNMDTRTVLSCIPYGRLGPPPDALLGGFTDQALFRSIWGGEGDGQLPWVYHHINHYKMFAEARRELLPLHQMPGWSMGSREFACGQPYPFKVVFCDIAIEGREVKRWTQPLFEATGTAIFGLVCCEDAGVLRFLVKAAPEIGCFDQIELGPTVQLEAAGASGGGDAVAQFFMERVRQGRGIMFDQLLSEEGGRFFHEQNRNILLRARREDLPAIPEGYFLLDYRCLNGLAQINNILNIQLRNLLALLEA